jgi:hypothetical protein
MKNSLLYVLSLLLVFASGCVSNNVVPSTGTIEGAYAGQFLRIHTHPATGAMDTVKANIDLSMETATGFKVTGDTSTVHAGSYGSYLVIPTASEVEFFDKTFPLTGFPLKTHLSGTYGYTFDGITLQITGFGAQDTLEYYYKLTRTGN